MIKKRELSDLDLNSVEVKLSEHYEKLATLRFQKSMGQLEKPSRIKFVRREIARINTILNLQEKKSDA